MHEPTPTSNDEWQVIHRPETGLVIESTRGTVLCRVDDGCIWLWDRKGRREVRIRLDALRTLAR